MKTRVWCALAVVVAVTLSAPHSLSAQQTGPDRLKGGLWGGGIGFVSGALLGGLSVGSGDDGSDGSLVEAAATGEAVVLGALMGAALGAVLGATVFAPDRRHADRPEVGTVRIASGWRVVPVTARGGVGLQVQLRW